MEEKKYTSLIRLRMSAKDAHYGGNLVDGAHMVHLFGDVATELLIQCDGDEGLFCAYNNIEFKAPVYAGDFIEAYGEITHIGNTSRTLKFEARKVAVPQEVPAHPSLSPSIHPKSSPVRPADGVAFLRQGGRTNSALSPPGPCAIIPLYFTA